MLGMWARGRKHTRRRVVEPEPGGSGREGRWMPRSDQAGTALRAQGTNSLGFEVRGLLCFSWRPQ